MVCVFINMIIIVQVMDVYINRGHLDPYHLHCIIHQIKCKSMSHITLDQSHEVVHCSNSEACGITAVGTNWSLLSSNGSDCTQLLLKCLTRHKHKDILTSSQGVCFPVALLYCSVRCAANEQLGKKVGLHETQTWLNTVQYVLCLTAMFFIILRSLAVLFIRLTCSYRTHKHTFLLALSSTFSLSASLGHWGWLPWLHHPQEPATFPVTVATGSLQNFKHVTHVLSLIMTLPLSPRLSHMKESPYVWFDFLSSAGRWSPA